MMNRFILLLALLLMQCDAFSQIKFSSSSNSFEEPREGYAKLKFLTNGNTVYIYVNNEVLLIKLFNAEYKEIANKEHKFPKGNLKQGELEKIFEVDGKLIVLINEYRKDYLHKYKAEINGENGEILSFEFLDETVRKYLETEQDAKFKSRKIGMNYLISDQHSKYYTLLSYLYDDNTQDYIAFILDKNNQVIKKFYYEPIKDANVKYSFLAGLAMNADKAVYILNNHELEKKERYKENEFELIVLNKENAQGVSKKLDVLEGEQPTDAIMKFNPVTNKLHIVSQIDLKSPTTTHNFFLMKTEYSKKYSIAHRVYNDLTNQFELLPNLDLTDIITQNKKSTEDHEAYRGVLQDFYFHLDGGYTFVLEGLKTTTKTHISTSQNTGIMHERNSTIYNLGSVASVKYSVAHQKQNSSLAIKEQLLNNALLGGGAGVSTSPTYHYNTEIGAQQLKGGNQYKSFGFIPGKISNYILFNDLEDNAERIAEKKDPKVIKNANDCNGYYFQSNNNTVLPQRQQLSTLNSKKDAQPYMFTVSDFDQVSGKYVTLKYFEEKGKKLSLAWFQAD